MCERRRPVLEEFLQATVLILSFYYSFFWSTSQIPDRTFSGPIIQQVPASILNQVIAWQFQMPVQFLFRDIVNDCGEMIVPVLLCRPPLWSSGQSSWLQNGDVLCFLWGTNWIYVT
jgi:hypothetical protein